jgi:hypothetical protein
LNIRDEFASILEQQVIATNVEATLIVHRGLYIRNPDNPEDKFQTIKRNVGNVTKQTEVTFEYGVRNKKGFYFVFIYKTNNREFFFFIQSYKNNIKLIWINYNNYHFKYKLFIQLLMVVKHYVY